MLSSLNLSLNWRSTRSWSQVSENKIPNGPLLSREGMRIIEGWHFGWKNGLASFGPLSQVFELNTDGDVQVYGRRAKKLRAKMTRASRDYARNRRNLLTRLLLSLVSIPLSGLAFLVTLITLPLYLLAWVIWTVIALFWMLFLFIASKAFGQALKNTLKG